eukprot:TRINITY_DN28419_c0_g1_i1.p1 TRINITY_DN28419_c0_g1~~TRINITY_DN28419_c0_g1_i1.p1  ORF type:complete len:327 (+),score=31.72 TRINITY_DN28419_c0_g1_i1:40-1020(+)
MERDIYNNGRLATFHRQLTGQLQLTELEAQLIEKCGVESLSQLMEFVGSGEHARVSFNESCHYKIERWYWYCRRTGWGDAGANTGKGKKRYIRNSHNQQVLSNGANELGGVSPTSPKRWEVHFDPWLKTSQDYGEHQGVPQAHDEGRVYPVINTNEPNEMSWCPPGDWAERRNPTDDPALTMPHTEAVQVFEVPKHHYKNFTRPGAGFKPRPNDSPSRRPRPKKGRPPSSTPPAPGSWLDDAPLFSPGVRRPDPNGLRPEHAGVRISPPRNADAPAFESSPRPIVARAPYSPLYSRSPSPSRSRNPPRSPLKKQKSRPRDREEFYI